MSGPFRTVKPIVLASGSPRRKDLLGSLGIDFDIVPSTVQEPEPYSGEFPEAYALRLAKMKALDVAQSRAGAFVLGADTVVAVGDLILGKPRHAREAELMLARLSGRDHKVVTGCYLAGDDGVSAWDYTITSQVRMAAITEEVIAAYVATGEPMDKAGAYAIQGQGAFMIVGIAGSYTNVVGLPLAETVTALLTVKAIATP
jgi:septum formation protein